MKENQHIEDGWPEQEQILKEKADKPDLAEMMNHPWQHSEEELCAFFDNPESMEDCRYALLARMADKRKKVAHPDVEQAWKSFASHLEKPTSGRKGIPWRMWGAALAGAVAMLAGILLYNYLQGRFSSVEGTEPVVAMVYDETPQHITLQDDEVLVDLSRKDSLSFRVLEKTAAERVASSVTTRPPKMQKLSTPRGMDFKVILPDGSEVWLNAESTIEFPATFFGNERLVLLKGEAYFKVVRNEECPFIVTSDRMKVRVLGTEFNFKSYTSETSHVSLVKGSVELSRVDTGQSDVTLKPGQDAWRDEAGEIHVREVDTFAVTQWVCGFFYFDNQPLVEILRELGRWYNLGVVFRNTASMHYKMHFSVSRNEEIGEAVENLNRLRKVRVRIEGTDIVVY